MKRDIKSRIELKTILEWKESDSGCDEFNSYERIDNNGLVYYINLYNRNLITTSKDEFFNTLEDLYKSIVESNSIEVKFIKDLADKYATVCEFKSDFPHHKNSVIDGFIEGFKVAERIIKINKPSADDVWKKADELLPTEFEKWFNENFN